MPRLTIACLLGLLPLTTGCTVIRQINSNLIFEKRLFASVEHLECDIEKDSEELLKIIAGKHPHKEFSKDFRDGFKAGYRDFLIYGGPIRPPAMPPTKYRNANYLSPHGHCQVRDYFQGFQYGAECADATGRRQFFTLPVLVTDQGPPPPLDIVVLPPLPDESADPTKPKVPTPAPIPATPEVPTPRKVDPLPAVPSSPPKPAVPEKNVQPIEPPKPVPSPKPPMPMPANPPMSTPPPPVPVPTTPTPVPTPKPEPKYDPIPKPVDPPKVDPIKPPTTQAIPIPTPMPGVPAVPASTGPVPIPLIPVMPSVSLGPVVDPAVVPVSGTSK